MSNLAAFSTENPAVAHLRYQDDAVADIGDFEMQCHIVPDTAVLQFVGEHKRPVVRLKGQVTKLTPTEQGAEKAQAYGIDEITFNTGPDSTDQEPRMVCDYVFDNDQLKTLIDKGLYEDEFDIPTDYLISNELRVPMAVSLSATAPEMAEGQSVLLYNIKDIRRSEVTRENSGFDLAEKCEPVREIESEIERDRAREVPQQQAGADMFSDVAYADLPAAYQAAGQSFEDTLEQSRNEQLPFVDRLRAMAPDEELEFIEVYNETFPSEDFVPEDVIALERKLEEDIRDKETSPLMKRYYEEREKREQKAELEARAEKQEENLDEIAVDDSGFDLGDEDLSELDDMLGDDEFDEVESESEATQAENVTPEADETVVDDAVVDETAVDEVAVDTDADSSQGDLGEDTQNEAVADMFEPETSGDGDLFANEDLADATQSDEDAERERRERRRATALSNDSVDVAGELNSGQEERISVEQTRDSKVGTEATNKHNLDETKRRERQRKSRQAQQSQDDGFSI